MNTDRRHALETNVLAKEITTWGERLRPYTGAIWAGIALLLLVFVGASMWGNYRAGQERAAWDEYELALLSNDTELKQLQQIATGGDHDGTEMQEWAYVGWADRQLRQASRNYLADRADANKRLTAIAAIYEQFAEEGSRAELRNRARLGLARVNEMQGRLDEAKKQYGLVEGALSDVATARIKALESPKAAEVTKWLATAELPKRSPPSGPGTPGARPGFEAATPSADGRGAGLDASQSIEEILGAIDDSENDERYGDAAETSATTSTPGESATTPAPETAPAETTTEPAATEPASEAASNEEAAAVEQQPAATEEPATPPAAETPAAPSAQ